MKFRKIASTVLVIVITALIIFYLTSNRIPMATGGLKGMLPNNSQKENETSISSFNIENKFGNISQSLSKFWQNLEIFKNLENPFEKFLTSNLNDERSFEDKCFTKFKKFPKNEPNFEFLETEEGKKYKKILAYHHAYDKTFYFGSGHEPFEEACCKEKRCFITHERNKIPLKDFDAVLIHFRDFKKKNLPKVRERHQRWVFYNREPPPFSLKNPQDYEGVFNWTMTYRRDSDIIAGYGQVYSKNSSTITDFSLFERNASTVEDVMKTKHKPVAWMVSHCNTPSKRDQYVKELKKYIEVDVYGDCGALKCSRDQNHDCYHKIEREYKFYLSFENNFCKDYVTEKLYNILNFHIVPVVRGSADYANIAPPNSYIDVKNFKTPKDLANYLLYLHKNDTAYMEYFKWKNYYFATNALSFISHASSFCSLCMKLHKDTEEKVYYNLKEWFSDSAECNKHL